MKKKQSFFDDYKNLALVLLALAVLLFVPAGLAKGGLSVFLYILSVLSLVSGIYCLYREHRARGEWVNLFLYDRRRENQIAKDALTYAFAEDALLYLLSDFSDDEASLWEGMSNELNMQVEATPALRSLLAFFMMRRLAEKPPKEIFTVFLSAEEQVVTRLCRGIRESGDREMADFVFRMWNDPEREEHRITPFFQRNKACFETRFVRHVKAHLSEFLMKK